MSRDTGKKRIASTVVAGLVALGGCSLDGQEFRQSAAVRIVAPANGAEVGPGFDLALALDPSAVGLVEPGVATAGTYLVAFVDRAPIAPGRSLLDVVDPDCRAAGGGCANRAYLAERGVFVTGSDTVTVTSPAPDALVDVVVVLMDAATNERRGEFAARARYRIR